MYKLEVNNIIKNFASRRVLRKVSFSLQTGDSLAVVGKNGSGKTTLLKVIAGLIRASKGTVAYSGPNGKLSRDELQSSLSYVGPEMTLYDALTAEENLKFFATMRGLAWHLEESDKLLSKMGLNGRGRDKYGAYSSGMKQRLKCAVALLNEPHYLFLDEPTSNLDEDGKQIVGDIIERQKENGILIIATNEQKEYGLAEKLYQLDD
ncbi:MAG: ABC transporter ATP-binding protein [candidate division Zixibacteria bacterium]|nr:ABC transporter ATP-binding protein [candidate division Zixibacteria bacterium]